MTSFDQLCSGACPIWRRCLAALLALAGACCIATAALAQAQGQAPSDTESSSGGPIRLRQPTNEQQPAQSAPTAQTSGIPPAAAVDATTAEANANERRPPAKAAEFETFARLPRFGVGMIAGLSSNASDFSPIVPPDYVIQPGDEILVTIWGSVDADLHLIVDRSGRISIPRIGPVMVAGTRMADLSQTVTRRASQVFKNFELSASLGRLRGVRIYVTGFVHRPGAYVVSALSTAMNAVMRAGGPTDAGSFRMIELRRNGSTVAHLDLYDLLLRGDRGGDRLLQPDDVVYVKAVGPQVAVRGSVNQQAIYELKPGETLGDTLRMAGGFNAVADRARVSIERLDERQDQRVVDLPLPASESLPLANGDIVRAYSAVDASPSVIRQNKRVKIDGEVGRPGEYLLPPNATISDALRAARGITPAAYLFGTEFTRQSVRKTQQENYDRALRDFETELVKSRATMRIATAEESSAATAAAESNRILLERLRALKPSGRVTFQLAPDAKELPNLVLEDGDALYIPPLPNTVGVFGSVFNSGSFLYLRDRTVRDYLQFAGGPTRGADRKSVFLVRANGTVESSLEHGGGGWFVRDVQIADLPVEPGDTIFVPEELNKTTWTTDAKDWTTILLNVGLGFAGLKTALGW
jgi:protein involved in polysaccharide export with SLBB domain